MRRVVGAALLTALACAGLAVWLQGELPPPVVPARPLPGAVSAPPPATAPAPTVKRAPAPEPQAAPADAPLISLDELLRLPPPPSGPESVEWAGERPAQPSGGGATSRPRRLRIDYSRKRVLEDVPKQPERRQTDVGVTVRVDEADKVRLRGGVRVDETDRGEPEPDREATPNVGVEVRF